MKQLTKKYQNGCLSLNSKPITQSNKVVDRLPLLYSLGCKLQTFGWQQWPQWRSGAVEVLRCCCAGSNYLLLIHTYSARISLVYWKRTKLEKKFAYSKITNSNGTEISLSPELTNPNEHRVRFSKDYRTQPKRTKASLISPCSLTFGERAHQKKSGIQPWTPMIRGGRYLLSRK